MRGRRRGRSSIRSRTRICGCCARIRASRRCGCGRWRAGWAMTGGKTIFDDYLREVRPRFVRRRGRFSARSIGRASSCSSICGSRGRRVPVGHGQTRRGWVVTAESGLLARRSPGALIFSKQAPDSCRGIGPLPVSGSAALPEKLVWDREGAIHAGGGRPTDGVRRVLRAAGGRLGDPATPAIAQAKGAVERSHRFMRTNFEPGRRFANPLDFQAAARRLVRARQRARAPHAPRRPDRAARRGARADAAAAGARCPTRDRRLVRAGAGASLPALRSPTTTRSTRAFAGRRVEVRVSPARGDRGRAGHRRARLPARARASPAA